MFALILTVLSFGPQGGSAVHTAIDSEHDQRASPFIEGAAFTTPALENPFTSSGRPAELDQRRIESATISGTFLMKDMAAIAADIYTAQQGNVVEGGWLMYKLLALSDMPVKVGSGDKVGLYTNKNNGKCVLAFMGTDNAGDVIHDVEVKTTQFDVCGMKDVHIGFLTQFLAYVTHENFYHIATYYNEGCKGGQAVVGHSLGGAVANIYAACASTKNEGSISVKSSYPGKDMVDVIMPYNEVVPELYTIGAPRTTMTQLVNMKRDDRIFVGLRMFNEGTMFPDPVPTIPPYFSHPKVEAVVVACPHQTTSIMGAVRSLGKEVMVPGTDNCKKECYDAASDESKSLPKANELSSARLHSSALYAARAKILDVACP